jgi:hypothetical protein
MSCVCIETVMTDSLPRELSPRPNAFAALESETVFVSVWYGLVRRIEFEFDPHLTSNAFYRPLVGV